MFIPGRQWVEIEIKHEGFGVSNKRKFLPLLFDIFVFGILIAIFCKIGEKRREIRRHQEEIDDFRSWEAEEAKFRIIGSIKRLNKLGITKIDLSYCYLKEANLMGINLRAANLSWANLERASMRNADLKRAIFHCTNLQGADLQDVNLEGAKLRNIWHYVSRFDQTNLQGANLQRANLKKATMADSILKNTNLSFTNLSKATFEEADLKYTYLSVKQLSDLKTLYKAKLDPELEKLVKEKCPHLLEKPERLIR